MLGSGKNGLLRDFQVETDILRREKISPEPLIGIGVTVGEEFDADPAKGAVKGDFPS